ncbi:MAG: cardiolipin synthetase [Limimaricola sp.]|uniref:phospholipase D-like domain-containing protein n=1 Tax=Limimaricola sp. TaxID=2211665 RepID=UPI001D37BCD3|nr:phospholipase D-like domain-containing protein [Limimaricola sp.]MBI1418711.1 cardiolipin synthetase [Limimaricola sp.]
MFWFETHVALAIWTVLALAATIIILQQRRTPQSTLAWLLAIILVPYVTLPLFLIFGVRRGEGHADTIRFGRSGAPPVQDDEAAVFAALGAPGAAAGHRFRLLPTGEECHAELSALIDEARESLDVMFYIVADDEIGRGMVDMLARRAGEGVKVRLMMDRFGSLRAPRGALARLRAAGGEVRFTRPFWHSLAVNRLNQRNHRKLVIADGARVFAGGMNVGREYMGPAPDPDRWTDLSFRLDGPVAADFAAVFAADWGTPAPPPPVGLAPGGTCIAQLVPAGPDMTNDVLHDGLVQALHAARRRIWIATPYFLPTELLANALDTAARRGVDVRILVPETSNQRIADFARGAYLRNLAEAGARVLLFEGGMMHAKMGVIDDMAWVGSANFDVRSMLLNFETCLFVHDAGGVAVLARWFEVAARRSREAAPSAGLGRRLSEGAFRLWAPVL